MTNKTRTNHGSLVPMPQPPQHPVFDFQIVGIGAGCKMREDETTNDFAQRLVKALYYDRE